MLLQEREKTLILESKRTEKLRKARLCFITSCFIKPFKTIINRLSSLGFLFTRIFFITQALSQRNFGFITEWHITVFISKIIAIF